MNYPKTKLKRLRAQTRKNKLEPRLVSRIQAKARMIIDAFDYHAGFHNFIAPVFEKVV